jgi:hypothetical protein
VSSADIDGNGSADMRVRGDKQSQRVVIIDNDTATIVSLDCNGDGDFTDAGELNAQTFGEFEIIDVSLSAGNDTLSYTIGSNLNGAVRKLLFSLGTGTNTLSVGNGASTIGANSSIDLEIRGSKDADTMTLAFGGIIDGSTFIIDADLGATIDTAVLNYGAHVSNGSVFESRVHMGPGNDILTMNLTGAIDSGSVLRLHEASGASEPEGDRIAATFASTVTDAQLFATFGLSSGVGQFAGSLADGFGVLGTGQAFLTVAGGGGVDTITLDQTGTSTLKVDGLLSLDIRGGSGVDAVSVGLNGAGLLEVGASGALRARVDGREGDDTVTLAVATSAASLGTYDVQVRGDVGNDKLNLDFVNGGGNAVTNFWPMGFVLMDGGYGTNACTISSGTTALTHKRGC